MSKKHRRRDRHGSGDKAHEAPAHGAHPLDYGLLGLAGAGILLTAYLTLVAWLGTPPAFCGADSDCDLVQQSRWATLLGLPIAFWGLATYALLARLVWRLRTRPSAWRMALTVAAVGAAVSWYLTAVSVLVIEATCAYCLASFAIANALFVLLLFRRPAHMPEHAWGKSLPAPAGAAFVAVLALAVHFSGLFDPAAGPEKPYLKGLAVHLKDSGARFYGAYWCPTCQKQKALFEASVERLPYIECTPNGRRGVRNFDCVANDVNEYPTWVIGGRRYTGLISVAQLAALSGFRGSGGGAGKQ
jgi:uncharacterized membrane protein